MFNVFCLFILLENQNKAQNVTLKLQRFFFQFCFPYLIIYTFHYNDIFYLK